MKSEGLREFSEMIAWSEHQDELALAWVESVRKRGTASQQRALVYRCKARGCSLLELYRSPDGLIVYRPRYKLSPAQNAEFSNASGRAANTEDGDRHWKASGGFLRESWEGWMIEGICDHHRSHITLEAILGDLKAKRRTVILG